MAKNEDGEFELVLGNRQLVSVFLIVVILLGVFFTMGYSVGRNSSNPTTVVDTHTPPEKPIVVEPADKPADTKPADRTPTADANPAVSKPSPAKPIAPAPAPAPAAQKNTEPGPAPVVGEPPPGDYWQIVATTRPDAEIISEALAKKGFRTHIAPAPKDGIFRVLVGPQKDAAAMAQARTSLEEAGFKNPIVRKY